MRYTFNIKEPKKNKETLILFSAYFKNEGRKFVYSTGESILPKEWDFENKLPNNLNGRTVKAENHRIIKRQLDRYNIFFTDLVNNYKMTNRDLTISETRQEFDKEFKRTNSISNSFFDVYELFLSDKKMDFSSQANATSTIRRYDYNQTLLKDFQGFRKKSIHFNQINKTFYNTLLAFCIDEKRHTANTVRRNVGLFKTFMNWALEEKHTFKTDFQKFKAPTAQETDEIALSFLQVQELLAFDLSANLRLEKVRDLFVFGCATGMRISNYSNVVNSDIQNGFIIVVDKKNQDKNLEIPLNELSLFVLDKYDYLLPSITTQKFNKYIKEVFKKLGYTNEVKKTYRIGNEIIVQHLPFYERISSHTARRSFITIMKNKKIPDKVIMSITGHKSLEVFNKYYKPSSEEKITFMQDVWKLEPAMKIAQ